ncbi:MAG: hypothetical protein DMD67_01320 [Gemmatimonadetes bacterium]|nr:MAG: hypothetical protein DMD67_01320 [Gemmatimonadota bacterium]
MHQVLDHPHGDAREVGQSILEARAAGRGPHVTDFERLELVGLLGREVVLANEIRDGGQELLVLEHQDLGVEDAGLIQARTVFGFGLHRLEKALDVAHGRAQPAHFLLDL